MTIIALCSYKMHLTSTDERITDWRDFALISGASACIGAREANRARTFRFTQRTYLKE